MANQDNKCSQLMKQLKFDYYQNSVDLSHGIDTLGAILDRQNKTQREVYGYEFNKMSLAEIMQFWHMNNHALIDEIHEATDALGGISMGGSAIWKKWKKFHSSYVDLKFEHLSEEDQLECKFEIVDILHFFMNMVGSIGMTSKELYNMYMLKNQENADRQRRGY